MLSFAGLSVVRMKAFVFEHGIRALFYRRPMTLDQIFVCRHVQSSCLSFLSKSYRKVVADDRMPFGMGIDERVVSDHEGRYESR
jgi:hypothetical protein